MIEHAILAAKGILFIFFWIIFLNVKNANPAAHFECQNKLQDEFSDCYPNVNSQRS